MWVCANNWNDATVDTTWVFQSIDYCNKYMLHMIYASLQKMFIWSLDPDRHHHHHHEKQGSILFSWWLSDVYNYKDLQLTQTDLLLWLWQHHLQNLHSMSGVWNTVVSLWNTDSYMWMFISTLFVDYRYVQLLPFN